MRRFLILAALAAALAGAAQADGYKPLGQCSQLQVGLYISQGLSDSEIREVCQGGGSISCDREQCSGQAVDTLRSEGFSEPEIQTMCGAPLCPEG